VAIRKNERNAALEEQIAQKRNELVAFLAGVDIGALSKLTPRNRLELEDKAQDALVKWEDDFRPHKKPNNKLEELCAQYMALKNEINAEYTSPEPQHDEDDDDDFADLDDDGDREA
jgi:hypothetical protein